MGGSFTTDGALVVRSWDAWLGEVTGIAESDACGRLLAELFPDLESRGLIARLRDAADHGTISVLAPAFHQYFIACSPRAASTHFAHMQQLATIAPLRAGEAIAGVTVTIEDVTSRLDAERDLALQLKSPDDAVRLQAVKQLATMDLSAGASEPLAGILGDSNWRVRLAAADGLAHVHDGSAVDALMAAVRDRHRDPAVLNAALTALVRTDQEVAPAVVVLLESPDSDADVRTYMALALGLLEDRRGMDVLLRALDDVDANVRFHAIEALGRIRSRQAAEPLARIAEARDFSVAFAALDALALIGDPTVAPRLVPLLDDDLLQAAAAEALGKLGSEDVIAPLAALLNRPGAPAIEVAEALASMRTRFEERFGEGALVSDIASAVLTSAAARNLIEVTSSATSQQLHGVTMVLGWLRFEGVDDALGGLLMVAPARRVAADALVARGAAAVTTLLGALGSDDDETRKAAAAALGRLGNVSAVPALVSLLDAEPEVAVVAAGALANIGDSIAFEPLIGHLGHAQAAVRQAVVGALNSIGHADMPVRVRELLGHPSPRVRESAAKIAGYFGYQECADLVLSLCHDEDDAVRRAAVEQLAHLDDPRALALLCDALRDGPPGERAAAARAFAHVPMGVALPQLRHACGDGDPWVRFYATRSIGAHRDAGALPMLISLARTDPLPPVRIVAIEALGILGAPESVGVLGELARDPDPPVAVAALAALGLARGDDALTPLLEALHSRDPDYVLTAMTSIARRGDAKAVGPLAELARFAGSGRVRERALDTLGAIGSEAAIAAVIELADQPRRSADVIVALTRVGEHQVAWVGRGLRHPDVEVRGAVVEALGRIAHGSATAFLVSALDDSASAVRLAAAQALGRLDVRGPDRPKRVLAR